MRKVNTNHFSLHLLDSKILRDFLKANISTKNIIVLLISSLEITTRMGSSLQKTILTVPNDKIKKSLSPKFFLIKDTFYDEALAENCLQRLKHMLVKFRVDLVVCCFQEREKDSSWPT
ncbi:hypothetical protein C0J52_18764 [Blattella germanica]|nr:hypothetical protein C0J52_18764 [Blattella germanica]